MAGGDMMIKPSGTERINPSPELLSFRRLTIRLTSLGESFGRRSFMDSEYVTFKNELR
jgi:hypothetical protein